MYAVDSLHSLLSNRRLDFYNYFQHGIDFLISSSDHVVRKIILHTNIVRSPRCHCLPRLLNCPCSLGLRYFNVTKDVTGKLRAFQKTMKTVKLLRFYLNVADDQPRHPSSEAIPRPGKLLPITQSCFDISVVRDNQSFLESS